MKPMIVAREIEDGLLQYDFAVENGNKGEFYNLWVAVSDYDNDFRLSNCSGNGQWVKGKELFELVWAKNSRNLTRKTRIDDWLNMDDLDNAWGTYAVLYGSSGGIACCRFE